MTISTQSHLGRFRRSAILSTLIFAPFLFSAQAIAGTATFSGNILSFTATDSKVYGVSGTGASSITLDNYTINGNGVWLQPDTNTTGTFNQTITLTGSTVISSTYSGAFLQSNNANNNVSLYAGADVRITTTGGFGGIWLRSDNGGNVYADSAATISVSGSGNEGVTAVTNLGSATVINSGTVSSANYRGLYADGNYLAYYNPLPTLGTPVTVSITNSGYVTALLEGARAINYYGLATVSNSGYVFSTQKYALIAWSNLGDASVTNSGTAISTNRSAIEVGTEIGNATVTNSGFATSSKTDASINSGMGWDGIQAYADVSGSITITNTATGQISAVNGAGIHAMTPEGNVIILNYGTISGLYGIEAYSGGGSLSFVSTTATDLTVDGTTNKTTTTGTIGIGNTGTISTTGLAVYADATSNLIVNTGLITTTGTLGVLTGNGNTLIYNSGTLSATGSNAVAIALGSGSNRLILTESSRITGYVINGGTNGTLELTGTGSGAFDLNSTGASAQYQGFGTLEKTDTGTWTLSGGSFGGNVTVSGGSVVLASAASLSGALTDNALLNLQTNVLTVAGSVSGTGTLALTIGSSDHGYLVNSAASSDLSKITLSINSGSEVKPNQTLVLVKNYTGTVPVGETVVSGYRLYRVVEAGGSGLDSQDQSYSAGSLLLTSIPLSATRGYTPVPTNNASLSVQNYTGSDAALGNLSLAVQSLTTASAINKAGAQLRPEANGGTQAAALTSVSQALQTITLRNDFIRANGGLPPVAEGKTHGLDLWGQTFYTNAAQGEVSGVDGFIANTAGLAIGADTQATDSTRVGASFAYASTNVNDRGTRAGSGQDVDSYIGSLYATYDGNPWYIDGAVVGGVHQYDSTRYVNIGNVRETARGSFSAEQVGFKLLGGYPIDFQRFTLTPIASLAYNQLNQDSYKEHGAPGADLRVESQTLNSLRSGLGAKIATTVATPNGWLMQPDLHAFWFHEFGNTAYDLTSQFVAAGGGSFTTPGIKLGENGLGLGTALSVIATQGVSVTLKYDAEIQQNYTSHNVVFEARFKF